MSSTALADNISNDTAVFNYTLVLGNESILIEYTSGFTHVWGEVVNITFMPPFGIDLGVVRCNVQPFTTPHLETTKYQMLCDFEYNITAEQVYVPIPLSMLKSFEGMKDAEKQLADTSGQLTFWRLLAVAVIMLLMAYALKNEWWDYRE